MDSHWVSTISCLSGWISSNAWRLTWLILNRRSSRVLLLIRGNLRSVVLTRWLLRHTLHVRLGLPSLQRVVNWVGRYRITVAHVLHLHLIRLHLHLVILHILHLDLHLHLILLHILHLHLVLLHILHLDLRCCPLHYLNICIDSLSRTFRLDSCEITIIRIQLLHILPSACNPSVIAIKDTTQE